MGEELSKAARTTLTALRSVADAVAQMFGPTCEVVIHRVEDGECRINYICNSQVTGRREGQLLNPAIFKYFKGLPPNEKGRIGYSAKGANGKQLKSATLAIHDEEGEVIGLFCMNVDITSLNPAHELLGNMLRTDPIRGNAPAFWEKESKSVHEVVASLVENVIQSSTRPVGSTKEAKLEAIDELDRKGIFSVRDVAPYVCDMLDISHGTFYNYLREVREQRKPQNE